jgi:hypothetical protein
MVPDMDWIRTRIATTTPAVTADAAPGRNHRLR